MPVTFSCPRCGMRSHNPNDVEHGYCGACHDYTGAEAPRYGQLPLMNMGELRDLMGAVDRRIAILTPSTTTTARDRLAVLHSIRTAIAEAMSGAQPVEPLTRIAQLRAELAAAPEGEDGRAAVKDVLAGVEAMIADVRPRWSTAASSVQLPREEGPWTPPQ